MKLCPGCSSPIEDSAKFCTACGTSIESEPKVETAENAEQPKKTEPTASGTSYGYQSGGYSAYPGDPYDHTADFDPRDISDNKVIAMLIYLMGIVGIVIALLSQNNSPYVAFHLRQALKIMVVSTLAVFIIAMLCWTVIVPLAGVCFIAALFVVKIICFFDICKGKAREPHIIRNFDFLR